MILHLHGAGHYHPANIIDNAFLTNLDIGTTGEWIEQRVGISTRHTALPLAYIAETRNRDPREATGAAEEQAFHMAAAAARMAIARAGIPLDQVGLVVAGGSSPDFGAPANANLVAAELNLDVPAFDLNSACSTFAYQMHCIRAAGTLAAGKFVLLVQPENLTKSVDYSDRRTAVLMGDAATAVLVSSTVAGAASCDFTVIGGSPKDWAHVRIPARGYLDQEGTAVQRFAIRRTVELARPLVAHGTYFIGHQANLLVLNAVARQCSLDDRFHHHNVARRGNCGAAGAPSVLSENWDSYVAQKASVGIAVVGAGLSWGAMMLRFGNGKGEES